MAIMLALLRMRLADRYSGARVIAPHAAAGMIDIEEQALVSVNRPVKIPTRRRDPRYGATRIGAVLPPVRH
ncbi:hypothetical protein NPJ82_09710 [Sphingomonas sp. NY01]|uniref:hypothetical protein n=1 Tax=Sphingomonas sp. NY01 TaxID=2968057 RepID=UPI00315D09A7